MKKVFVSIMAVCLMVGFAFAQGEDWKAKCEAKVKEIEGVVEIITPVKDFLVEKFTENPKGFSDITTEEWLDTQVQLGAATKVYGKANARMDAGKFDKLTFLKLEETWQLFVKTGVAGLRAKGMVEAELTRK